MNLEKAIRIEELRSNKGYSWRALSEIICDEFIDEPSELRGNQMHGYDLCVDALHKLYDKEWKNIPDEIKEKWMM